MATVEPGSLGRRLVVWGVTGSGKSTLSRRIGRALGVDVVELDALRHARGWDSVPWDEMGADLGRRLVEATPGWVIDGSYVAVQPLYLPQAESLIWIDLPLRVTWPRLLRRSLDRVSSGTGVYGPGSGRETFRQAFLSRESLLLYALLTHRATTKRRRARARTLAMTMNVIELRGSAEMARFSARLPPGPLPAEAIEHQDDLPSWHQTTSSPSATKPASLAAAREEPRS